MFRFPDASSEATTLELVDKTSTRVDGTARAAKSWPFNYNRVFTPTSTQEEVFGAVQGLINNVADGKRVCIFAYGQTGAGKTYTMQGGHEGKAQGLIPRSIQHLFHRAKVMEEDGWRVSMTVEVLEIYNEVLKDLLAAEDAAAAGGSPCRGVGSRPSAPIVHYVTLLQPAWTFTTPVPATQKCQTKLSSPSSRQQPPWLRLHGRPPPALPLPPRYATPPLMRMHGVVAPPLLTVLAPVFHNLFGAGKRRVLPVPHGVHASPDGRTQPHQPNAHRPAAHGGLGRQRTPGEHGQQQDYHERGVLLLDLLLTDT